jgi:hypothetical protein
VDLSRPRNSRFSRRCRASSARTRRPRRRPQGGRAFARPGGATLARQPPRGAPARRRREGRGARRGPRPEVRRPGPLGAAPWVQPSVGGFGFASRAS